MLILTLDTVIFTIQSADLSIEEPQLGETSTMKLPPEILLAIFSQLDRNSIALIRVSAVCRRWRAMTTHTPYLWTDIKANCSGLNKKRTRALQNRVELFLTRSGELPLDVEWHADNNNESVLQFYHLFRQKGAFSRWRTLSLGLGRDADHPLEEVRDIDAFSSLEYLMFVHAPPLKYLNLISKTVTTRLHTLELGGNLQCSPNLDTEYSRILQHASTIKIWSGVALPIVPLPPNVSTLQAHTMPDIAIPHVKHLFVKRIGLKYLSGLDVINLVTLLIHINVNGTPSDFTITLPNLLWLGMKEDSFPALAAFKVPLLHTLIVETSSREVQTVDGPFITALYNGFQVSKLVMLFLDMRLDGMASLEVLRRFPDLSRLGLHCLDMNHGKEILTCAFPGRINFNLCPSLDVLRLILDVGPPASCMMEWQQCVRDTVRRIGDSFWMLETRWPNGKCVKYYGIGERKRVACIYPWRNP